MELTDLDKAEEEAWARYVEKHDKSNGLHFCQSYACGRMANFLTEEESNPGVIKKLCFDHVGIF